MSLIQELINININNLKIQFMNPAKVHIPFSFQPG